MDKKIIEQMLQGKRAKYSTNKDFTEFLAKTETALDKTTLKDFEAFVAEQKELEDVIYDALSGKTALNNITIKDMLQTSEHDGVLSTASRRVFMDELEPALFLSEVVAEKIPVGDNEDSITFLETPAFTAKEMSDTEEYTLAGENMRESMASLRVGKQGIAFAMPDSLINSNKFDLWGRYQRKGAAAVNRLVESNAFATIYDTPNVAFDNGGTDFTTGVDSEGVRNYSASYYDFVTAIGGLMANERNATHILYHPMAWSVFQLDPILRSTIATSGQLGSGIWNQSPEFDQNANMPYNVIAVPYPPATYTASKVVQSLTACPVADFLIIDKAKALYLAEKGAMMVDEAPMFFRDARAMKICRKTKSGLMDKGLGVVKMADVRIARNYEPALTVRSFDHAL